MPFLEQLAQINRPVVAAPGEKDSFLTKSSIKQQQQPCHSLGPHSLVVKVFIVLSKTVTENKCAAQMGP